jgi:hypothetical protein
MVECCEGCEHSVDDGPNHEDEDCWECSEFPYESHYTPRKTRDSENVR